MPDANKHAVLAAQGFALRSCGVCAHWQEREHPWGLCMRVSYLHGKHLPAPRRPGVPCFGICDAFEPDPKIATTRTGEDYTARYLPDAKIQA
jgi:hypothetical protein